jgi:hypothetical protein
MSGATLPQSLLLGAIFGTCDKAKPHADNPRQKRKYSALGLNCPGRSSMWASEYSSFSTVGQ